MHWCYFAPFTKLLIDYNYTLPHKTIPFWFTFNGKHRYLTTHDNELGWNWPTMLISWIYSPSRPLIQNVPRQDQYSEIIYSLDPKELRPGNPSPRKTTPTRINQVKNLINLKVVSRIQMPSAATTRRPTIWTWWWKDSWTTQYPHDQLDGHKIKVIFNATTYFNINH